MKRITRLAALVAAVSMCVPSFFAQTTSANAGNLEVAQVDVQVGGDRDRDHRDRDRRDLTVGIGPGGVRVGPREHCRTVTTTVQRDDGRTVTRKQRQCD